MRRDCILSPYNYMPLLSVPGAITKERFSYLHDIADLRNSLFNRIITIYKNLDFAPKSLEIIAGRIELFCEQNGLDRFDFHELERILSLLSNDILGLVKRDESGFSKLYPDVSISSRVAGIVGFAHHAPLTIYHAKTLINSGS